MSKINFFALGGMDERGKSCFVLEINNGFYLFDVGILTPNFSKYGIKKIMFDYTWIQKNIQKIKGLFIGIANLSNIGSLQFLNSIFKNIPIYTSTLNKLIIESLFNERSMQNVRDFQPYKIIEVEPMKPLVVSGVEITPIQITAINPLALGFCIKTDQGYITVVDEFIVSPEPNPAFQSQLDQINLITNHNNLLLITAVGSVSQNKAFVAPSHDPTEFFLNQIKTANGRLMIGIFDYNIYHLIKLVDLCTKLSVPILLNSGIFVTLLRKFEELKIIKPKPPILNVKSSTSMTKGVVLIIGSRNKLFDSISQILDGENKIIAPNDNDKYILAIKTIPGFEFIEAKTYDKISYLGYDWMKFPNTINEVSPGLNDHLYLLSMLRPKYVIPVKGLHYNFSDYAIGAKEFMNQKNVISLDNGFKITFENGNLVNQKPLFMDIQEKFVGSYGLNAVEEIILNERKLMSENGVVLVNTIVAKENNKASIVDLRIQCFGISYEGEGSKEAYATMLELVKKMITENFYSRTINNKELKNNIRKIVSKYFNKMFQKAPIVLPSIIDVTPRK